MRKIPFIVLLFIFFIPNVWGQSLERDIRAQIYGQGEASGNAPSNIITINTSGLSNTADRESRLVSQQLDVISGDEETRYIIVPGDTLTISYNDRDATNTAIYQVSGDGEIFLPLAGKTKIAGLNRRQAQDIVNEVMGQFIRNTQAIIKINMDGRVMVVGAVERPGIVEFNQQHLTVMEALLNAGIQSFDPKSAKLNSVLVMRGSPDKPIVLKLDLKKMIRNGDRSDNIELKPGDLIYVPTTFLSELDGIANNLYQKYFMWSDMGGQDLIKAGKPFLNLSHT